MRNDPVPERFFFFFWGGGGECVFLPNPETLCLHSGDELREQGGLYGELVHVDTVVRFYAHITM